MLAEYPILRKVGTKSDGKLYEFARLNEVVPIHAHPDPGGLAEEAESDGAVDDRRDVSGREGVHGAGSGRQREKGHPEWRSASNRA